MAVLEDIASLSDPMAGAVDVLKQHAGKGSSSESDWHEVATAGKTLADTLQTEELRSAVGEKGVLEACGALLRQLISLREEQPTATEDVENSLLRAQTELVRVVGNLCFDHDENRQRTLDAGIPLAVARLLAIVLDCDGSEPARAPATPPQRLSLDEIKFVRAATGAFLNSSLKFDPMRRELARKEVLRPLLALLDFRQDPSRRVQPLYRVGEWSTSGSEERRDVASTAVRWAANVLEDVMSEDKQTFPAVGVDILASSVLDLHHRDDASLREIEPEELEDWIDTDIELLTISASLLEGVVLESEEAKVELAFSSEDASSSASPKSLLERLLDFIESAKTPSYWLEGSDDPARIEKAFSAIKASVVRAVVEAPNSDEVMKRLWTETRVENEAEGRAESRSWLVERLVKWLHVADVNSGREDLLICAAHMLASLGRKDEYTLSLVRDYRIAEPLADIVRDRVGGAIGKTGRAGETTQILFGVVSLLRHLAIPVANREVLGNTGVTPALAQLLRAELDVVQPLQLAVIGLLKHLSYPSVQNVLELFGFETEVQAPLAPTQQAMPAPVDLVVGIAERVDDLRLRSESARVLVNAVRTLFGPTTHSSTTTAHEDAVGTAQKRLSRTDVVGIVAELVRNSSQHPMLVNEGMVALALLASQNLSTASLALDSLLASPAPRGQPIADDAGFGQLSLDLVPSNKNKAGPAPATDVIVGLFARADSSSIPPEMLSNAANLLLTLCPAASNDSALSRRLGGPLRRALQDADADKSQLWSAAVERVLAELAVA
ncbi:hypothetical protein RHOSPDRAFT_37134 [Rhodotorula sp. JG-1b]|nr:hypothetical protein RHOSPDRAFT_37134 [Rhodotorula sp. JG-1b]